MILNPHKLFEPPLVQSLLKAFDGSMFSLVITDTGDSEPHYRFLYVNERFQKQCGYSEEELKHLSPKILQGPRTHSKTLAKLHQALKEDRTFIGQTTNYRKDGSEYIVRWSINPIRDENDRVIAYISCQQEVTEFVQKREEALFLAEAINQSADAALITDIEGTIVYANKAFSALTGYELHEIKGKNTRMLKSGKMDEKFYKNMWETLINNESFKGVFLNRHKNGREFFEQKTITPILDEDNRPMYYLAISKDNSDVIQKTHHLEYKAYHDSLTGLFNRSKFDEVINVKLRHLRLNGEQFSLIIADVDDFKKLNDTHGHDAGDDVLRAIAEHFQNNLRKGDLIFRWGGEEFAVLIDSDLGSTEFVADLLRSRIAKMEIDSLPGLGITMSFGVTEAEENDHLDTLFKRADQALYQAKSNGKNQVQSVFHTPNPNIS
ncbi:MAG: sensor domain-containing diguanylate cyclase [Hydrogenovibrio sp.]